jgi:FkbM family methyltransferase
MKVVNKISLGSGDGEWCLCADDLDSDSVIYSFGVGYDIGFELGLIRRLGCEVHAFDPTPLSIEWVARQRTSPRFHFHPFGIAGHDGTARFHLPESHAVSFTVLDAARSKMTSVGEVYRLPTILTRLGHRKIDLLKLDVEGAEFAIMDDISGNAGRISQILIEFHDRLLGRRSVEGSGRCIEALRSAGFEVFHVSPRGTEYGFLRG